MPPQMTLPSPAFKLPRPGRKPPLTWRVATGLKPPPEGLMQLSPGGNTSSSGLSTATFRGDAAAQSHQTGLVMSTYHLVATAAEDLKQRKLLGARLRRTHQLSKMTGNFYKLRYGLENHARENHIPNLVHVLSRPISRKQATGLWPSCFPSMQPLAGPERAAVRVKTAADRARGSSEWKPEAPPDKTVLLRRWRMTRAGTAKNP